MSKPIEPGCRARIIDDLTENENVIVEVIKTKGICNFSSVGGESFREVGWIISPPVMGDSGKPASVVREGQLQRIDDYDGNDVISWDDKRCVWQPEKVVA